MKVVITDKKVEQEELPENEFLLVVEFDNGDDVVLNIETEEELLKYYGMYNEYMINLEKNWNIWCNPEYDDIEPLKNKYFPEEEDNDDLLYDIWSKDQEYSLEPFARVIGLRVTYFDSNSEEFEVNIIKD